jgi:REP element-mobilizing transposase RayT
LGQLIAAFKAVSTKRINQIRSGLDIPLWQRNYYEHIIRTEESLNLIREYIVYNPASWAIDPNNPAVAVRYKMPI